jgi:hypothetical protein
LCANLAAAWFLAGGCTAGAEMNSGAIRRSARRAIDDSRTDFPAQAQALERLITDAERISAAEAHAPFWRHQPERVAAAWHRVAQAAWESARLVHAHRRETEQRWLELLPVTSQAVERARVSVRRGAGLGRREMSALERAELNLATAQKLAARGELARAITAGEEALDWASIVESGWDSLHERFEDPKLLRRWRGWVETTVTESKRRGSTAIIVDKLRRKLHVYDNGTRIATYPAELGANGLRPKNHAGDRATPEGRYTVVETRQNGATKYYKALLLNYPNAEDQARFRAAQKRGTIPARVGIGSLIEVHGKGGDGRDWTDGCVALANKDMDQVFKKSRAGTPVTIVGTF